MAARNAFYAQSGGVTAVINATACGLIQEARRFPEQIGKVYAGRDGLIGALNEELIDTSRESDAAIARLRHTPGGAFGSCRFDLPPLDADPAQYERLFAVLAAHDIGYFFLNGGNGSMDTAWKVAQMAERFGYPLSVIGVPKTVDNDLALTDCCPGFGSVAKYVATSLREASYDLVSMARTSTKVFVLEVMGRNAGWITAACGLAAEQPGEAPHLLLFPEIPFEPERFLARVDACVREHGFCTVAVAEGLAYADGRPVAAVAEDGQGHIQLGGIGRVITGLIQERLGYKHHSAVADYLQRAARHLASRTDLEQAHAVGAAAVQLALSGRSGIMATIERISDHPYRWQVGAAPLAAIANVERKMPLDFISADGFHITTACRNYLQPLIEGEEPPPYRCGLPDYVRLQNTPVARKLPPFAL